MSVVVIAFVTVNEDQPLALAKYLDILEPLLARFGAKIARRYRLDDTSTGKRIGKTVIVLEFPDRTAVDRVLSSPQYKKAAKYRDIAFSEFSLHIPA
mgnify:CR=1 FL=1